MALSLIYFILPTIKKIRMSLEEYDNKPDPKMKRYQMMRSITDFGMGIIYVGVAVFIFFSKQFNFSTDFTSSVPAKLFAVLAFIYGSWRIYRGFRKNYFKE